MSNKDAFSPDYVTARARFMEAATRAGAQIESYPTGQDGPSGEALAIDVARLGDANASRALVVSSGLHGIEGFFGSAVQLRLFERLRSELEILATTNVVLIHALDPHGFAHLRRFDENNVDLNRNFLLDGQEYRGCPPRYAQLDAFLNPKRPPNRFSAFRARAYASILRYGFNDLKQAVAGGQFEFPRGLFFGGHGPAQLRGLLSARLPEWIGPAGHVVHLDYHTGLGRLGRYELLIDECVDAARRARLGAWFGEDRVRGTEITGLSYEVRGGLGAWCEALFPDRSYTLLCAEFGTYAPLTVLQALRAENQAHHWGNPRARSTRRVKRDLLEAFAPADPVWRMSAVEQGVVLVQRALRVQLDVAAPAQPEIGR
jgi:Protein of unknown function (DUF2817)